MEESKRLIELDVNVDLAIDRYDFDDDGNEIKVIYFRLENLLAILPKKITDRKNIYNLTIGVNSEDSWYAKYLNDNECWDTLNSYQEDNELCDCIYDMIVWLKENKELTWL